MAPTASDIVFDINEQHARLSRVTMAVLCLLVVVFFTLSTLRWQNVYLEGRLRTELHASYAYHAAVRSFLNKMQAADAAERGYLITGDEAFLKSFDPVVAERPKLIASMRRQAALQGLDTRELSVLDRLSKEKLDEMAEAVRLRRLGKAAAAAALVHTNLSRPTINAITDRIDAYVTGVLAERNRQADAAWRRTQIIGTGLGLLFVSALLGGAAFIRQVFSHRHRLFQQLQETSARQAAILNSANDAIITLNPSGTIETINRAGERLFGYSPALVDRRDIGKLLELNLKGEGTFLARLGVGIDDRESVALESIGVTADGRRFPADVSLGAMQLEGGAHVVAVVRDITERRRAEEVKDQFIAAVSHELRTPLTSITGSLGLLNGGVVPGLPEPAKRLIKLAHSNSERLGRLVNDILDIEKMQSGRMRFDRERFDLRAVFRKAADDLESYTDQFGVRVHLREDEPPVWAWGDAERIVQVATNLISNAVKFSPEGGQVRVGFAVKDGVAQASVSDDGPGIPEAFRSRVFSRFAQADGSDTRQRGGTGLGLAICKQILERQEGSIFFTTETGRGARFFVNLPAADAPADLPCAPAPSARAEPPPAARVLICEDDPEMAEFLSAIVAAEGGEADVVRALGEAEAALRRRPYAALFLDMKLPDGEGLDLLGGIAPAPHGRLLPVVVISGEEARQPRRIGAGARLIDWVEKPLHPGRLRKALREAMQVFAEAQRAGRPVILHVEDDPDVAALVAGSLADLGEVVSVDGVAAAKHALALRTPDLVVLDLALADGTGSTLLPFLARQKAGRPAAIVFSAQDSPPQARDVDLVLTKSRASLARLATEAARLLQARAAAPPAEAA